MLSTSPSYPVGHSFRTIRLPAKYRHQPDETCFQRPRKKKRKVASLLTPQQHACMTPDHTHHSARSGDTMGAECIARARVRPQTKKRVLSYTTIAAAAAWASGTSDVCPATPSFDYDVCDVDELPAAVLVAATTPNANAFSPSASGGLQAANTGAMSVGTPNVNVTVILRSDTRGLRRSGGGGGEYGESTWTDDLDGSGDVDLGVDDHGIDTKVVEKKLRKNVRNRLMHIIRQTLNMNESAEQLVGCSMEQYRTHVERQFVPGMSWRNHGAWHIDHIKPLAQFRLVDPLERARAFHYSNTRPLWAHLNLSKGTSPINPLGPGVSNTGASETAQ